MLPVTTNGDGDEVDEELTEPPQDVVETAEAAPPPAADADDSTPLSREAWLDEFDRQSTEEGFEEGLKRHARMRARYVAHARRTVDDNYVCELIQDAVEDTFDGTIIWDPRRFSLKTHLYRTSYLQR